MSQVDSRYTLSTTTELGFTDAVTRVREELANEGFGVLCEIDVQATLKQKLGIDREPYLILGACNPPLAHAALEAEPELGVLLPCNVVVYQQQGQVNAHRLRRRRADALHRRQRRTRVHGQRGEAASIRRGRPRRPELTRPHNRRAHAQQEHSDVLHP